MGKKIQTTNAKCSGCGGDLRFDPTTCNLGCPNCGVVTEFDKTKEFEKHQITEENKKKSIQNFSKEERVFNCNSCGAKIVLVQNEVSQKCPYCGSSYITQTSELAGLKPDAIIPFAMNEQQAVDKFKENIKKKFFVPRAFKKNIPSTKIMPVYIPSFCFDGDMKGTYSGVLERTKTRTVNGKTHTYTERFNISGDVDFKLSNVVVESSKKFDMAEINEILPFDHSRAYAFDYDFVRGYPLEHYDEDLTICHQKGREAMNSLAQQDILRNYNYTRVVSFGLNVDYLNETFYYEVLPIYNFDLDYKEKHYLPRMNGQTGKVDGDLPKSWLKVFFAALPFIIFFGFIIFTIFF